MRTLLIARFYRTLYYNIPKKSIVSIMSVRNYLYESLNKYERTIQIQYNNDERNCSFRTANQVYLNTFKHYL